ncbi:MAG: FixH family protein [Saprospiraceae bacterium]
MKINWGTGIALVYGLFALTMVAVVIRSRSHDPGLVSQDYYNLDLNYQAHIDKKHNAAALKTGLTTEFDRIRQVVRLRFPAEAGMPSGKIKCFRSSTTRDDMFLDIKTDATGIMEIPTESLATGLWNIEVDWQAHNKSYFHEALITITRASGLHGSRKTSRSSSLPTI